MFRRPRAVTLRPAPFLTLHALPFQPTLSLGWAVCSCRKCQIPVLKHLVLSDPCRPDVVNACCQALDAKVILIPGSAFLSDAGATSSYVRAAYSTSTPAAMDEALARLAQLLTDHHANKN